MSNFARPRLYLGRMTNMLHRVYRTRISCSHCGELNEAGVVLCRSCGHCADRPRMACVRRQCTGRGMEQGSEAKGGEKKLYESQS